MSARRRSKSRARGMTLVYLSLALVALMALVSLAVDLGRVRVAKSELCTAVDAAARYAATGLGDGTAVAKAIAAAADNQVDGSALVLTGADVTTGVWSDGTFTAGGSAPNAVRVATGRTQSRGNGIPLLFGQVVGGRTCDVTASAVATIVTRPASYGVIALGKMAQSGGTIDSYDSRLGNYSAAAASSSATVGCNGDVSLSGPSVIRGDVYLAPGKQVSGGAVTGSVTNLSAPLSYPAASVGNAATVNDNANLPGAYFSGGQFSMANAGTLNLPGGVYYVTKLTMSGASTINFSGPTTLYVTGTMSLSGDSMINPTARPGDLKIRIPPSSNGISLSNNARIDGDVYGDGSLVSLSGQSMICGIALADSFKLSGTAAIHVDTSLLGTGAGGGTTVSLVR